MEILEIKVARRIDAEFEAAAFTCISKRRVEMCKDYSFIDNTIGFKIIAMIRGDEAGEAIVRWPASLWDAFKERWFSYRLKRWFPVKYQVRGWSIVDVEGEGVKLIPKF